MCGFLELHFPSWQREGPLPGDVWPRRETTWCLHCWFFFRTLWKKGWQRLNEQCIAVAKTFKIYEISSSREQEITILSGGSLGSWVDEERSYLRDLM